MLGCFCAAYGAQAVWVLRSPGHEFAGSSPFLSSMCDGKGLEGYYPSGTLDFLCVSGLWHLVSVLLGGVVFKARLCVQSACFVGLVWLMVICTEVFAHHH